MIKSSTGRYAVVVAWACASLGAAICAAVPDEVHERPLAVVGDALDEVRPVALGVSLALLELGRSQHLSVADLEMLCKPRSIDVFSLDHVRPTSDQANSGR